MDYQKYLITEKSTWSTAFDKILKTVKSVKTQEQLDMVEKMFANYLKTYGKDMDDPAIDKYTEPMRAVVQKRFRKAIDDARRRIRK